MYQYHIAQGVDIDQKVHGLSRKPSTCRMHATAMLGCIALWISRRHAMPCRLVLTHAADVLLAHKVL